MCTAYRVIEFLAKQPPEAPRIAKSISHPPQKIFGISRSYYCHVRCYAPKYLTLFLFLLNLYRGSCRETQIRWCNFRSPGAYFLL